MGNAGPQRRFSKPRAGRSWAKALAGLAAITAAVLGATYYLTSPLSSGHAAYKRGAWAEAEAAARARLQGHPTDREAWRLLARARGRQGDVSGAQSLYRQRVGVAAMTAEDFVVAAAGLSRLGQAGQARLALDKARAIEPDHPEALDATIRLDLDEDKLAEAGKLANRLSTLRGWEARGFERLAQVAERKNDPASAATALAKALSMGPARALATPEDMTHRLARSWLAAGFPERALVTLRPLLDRGPDAEASHLQSRALLHLGKPIASEPAGKKRDPMKIEAAPFVGAARCAGCHAAIYRDQQTSRHALTFPRGKDFDALPLPGHPVPDPEDQSVRHDLRRTQGRNTWETTDRETLRRAVVDYAFGSGAVAVTFVGHDDAGEPCELRLSLYKDHALWDLTTGHLPRPADRREFLGRPVGKDGVRRCLECHTTSAFAAEQESGPTVADHGIGCERCHGPGANHLDAVAARLDDPAIARPRLATSARVMELCASCHSPKDAKLTPTSPLAPRFASPSLAWSRCYQESAGALSCLTCHDPHRNAETAPAFYESRCLACHSPPNAAVAAHSLKKQVPANLRRVPCPIEPSQGCLKCHMPKVEGVVPHATFTDHRVRVRTERAAPKKP